MERERTEHYKDVWRAVRQSPHAINVTDQVARDERKGLICYEDQRQYYDDGRTAAELLKEVDGRKILFVPFVPQPDEQPLRINEPAVMSAFRVGAS